LPGKESYKLRLVIGEYEINSDEPKGKIKGTANNWFYRSKNVVFKSPC